VIKFKIPFSKNIRHENDGFSVIELMLAIVIAGMMMGAVGGFLTAHIKSFETTLDVIDVQYEGQLALNALSKVAMESKGIYHVQLGVNDQTDANIEIIDPLAIGFLNADESYTLFYFDKVNNKIIFKDEVKGSPDYKTLDITDTSKWFDFAFNIDSWRIKPGVGGKTYAATDNVYIYMHLLDDGSELTLSNLFKFRNKVN